MLFVAAFLYICLGLGIVRVKIVNNRRLWLEWRQLPALEKAQAVVLSPLKAVVWGWEMIFIPVLGRLTGVEVRLVPERDTQDADG